MKLREFLHPGVERELLLELPHRGRAPGVVVPPEEAAEVPLEHPELGADGDSLLRVVSESDVIVKIETEPTKVTAGSPHYLLLTELGILPEDRMVEEQVAEVQGVLHSVHSGGGDVESANEILFSKCEEAVLVVTDG